MPVRNNGVGESQETPTKQKQLAGFLDMHLSICKSIWNSNYYWCDSSTYQYFDLYAGCGTWGNGELGSALIFIDAILRQDMPFKAVFIDKEPNNIAMLKDSIPESFHHKCDFIADNNRFAIRPYLRVIQKLKRKQLGLIYADPNGLVDWDILSWMSRMTRYERTDILIYLSANRGLKLHRRSSPDNYKFLTEYLERIDKKVWLIREPRTNFEWTFLFGTRWADMPEWRKEGFYDLRSRQGREILLQCNFTKAERQGLVQPHLF